MKKFAAIVKSIAAIVLASAFAVTGPMTAHAASAPAESASVSVNPSVYDLILFWGQSNMVGSAIGTANPFRTAKRESSAIQ